MTLMYVAGGGYNYTSNAWYIKQDDRVVIVVDEADYETAQDCEQMARLITQRLS